MKGGFCNQEWSFGIRMCGSLTSVSSPSPSSLRISESPYLGRSAFTMAEQESDTLELALDHTSGTDCDQEEDYDQVPHADDGLG